MQKRWLYPNHAFNYTRNGICLVEAIEDSFHLFKHFAWFRRGIDCFYQTFLLIVAHNRHRIVDVCVEALFERFNVIVRTTATLASLQASLNALILGALEEEHEQQLNLV